MRYLVRERLLSSSDDSWVTDERGDKVFPVDGKPLRLRETFELKDASGAMLATIRKKVLAFTDTSRPSSPSFDHPFDDRRMFRGGFGLVG